MICPACGGEVQKIEGGRVDGYYAEKSIATRQGFEGLTDRERDYAQNAMLGFLSGYVPLEHWKNFVAASRDMALSAISRKAASVLLRLLREAAARYDKGVPRDE